MGALVAIFALLTYIWNQKMQKIKLTLTLNECNGRTLSPLTVQIFWYFSPRRGAPHAPAPFLGTPLNVTSNYRRNPHHRVCSIDSGFGGSRRPASWRVIRSKLVGSGTVCHRSLTTSTPSMKELATVKWSSSAVTNFQLYLL